MGVEGGDIRLLDRILKVRVQIISGLRPLFHDRRLLPTRVVWGHAPSENFKKLKPLRHALRDSNKEGGC